MQQGYFKHVILLSCLYFLSLPAWANSPILVPNESFDYLITPYVSVLEDNQNLSIDNVLVQQIQLRFRPSHSDHLELNATGTNYWLRFSITNPYKEKRLVTLSLSNPSLEQVSFYNISELAHPKTQKMATKKTGSYLRAFPYMLSLPAQTTSSYLIRIVSNSPLRTSLHLSSLDTFILKEQGSYTAQGIGIGSLLLMMLYLIYLFWQTPVLSILIPAAYCAAAAAYSLSFNGLLPTLPNVSNHSNLLTGNIFLAGAIILHTLSVACLSWHTRWIKPWLLTQTLLFTITCLIIQFTISSVNLMFNLSILLHEALLLLFLMLNSSRNSHAQRVLAYGITVALTGLLLNILGILNIMDVTYLHDWLLLIPCSIGFSLLVACTHSRDRHKITKPAQELALTPSLLARMNHELRSPINGVMGMADLMRDTPMGVEQRNFINTISHSARDLMKVINDISDLTKIQTNSLKLEHKAFNTRELLTDTLHYFQEDAGRKNMELALDIADNLPSRVMGDPARLQSLLQTLIGKCLGYCEQGELTLSVHHYQDDNPGQMIQLRIHAHIVHPDELKAQLQLLKYKQPLYHEQQSSENWSLLILRRILKHMRANLEVETITSRGMSVCIYTPLATDIQTEKEPQNNDLSGHHILIVDDNISLRSLLENQAKRWGMRVTSTYSGKEALALMRNQCTLGTPFDLIIIDHDMPLMNGLQLSRRIGNDDDIHPKPARLMLTGMSIHQVQEEAREAGIEQLLAKPANSEHLRQALMKLKQ